MRIVSNNKTLTKITCIKSIPKYICLKIKKMRLLKVKRKTKYENRYTQKMGRLQAKNTYIKKYFLGFPIKTLHKYRETYYGKVKDCNDCELSA
tara:strand:+ start:228 stop:506 length:279 start_codon:yes stop_codon:yes gene_type:complete